MRFRQLELPRRIPGKRLGAMLATAALLILALPNAQADSKKDSKTTVDKQNGKSISDADIVSAVESRLAKNPATPSWLIDVNTHEGIVTLSGSVNNLLAKERAMEIAQTLKGVRSVVNRIEVKPVTRSDAEIHKDVERAILMDPATDSYEVTVKVSDGIVTLTGKVHSWQEKRLSAEVAKSVKGVKEVKSEITIQYKDKRADSEIEADVKRRLATDVWVDGALITVGVKDGKVTLTGTVGSATEHVRAAADAWVLGVTTVDASGLKVDKWWSRGELRRPSTAADISDEAIKKAVKDAFFYDPRVYSFSPNINVQDGVVTLTGVVDNLKAKQAAEQDARNTRGVARVKNYLKVRPAQPVSDADIAANIRSALLWDPYVDHYQITVSVANGRAYISGTVDSYYEKWRAEDVTNRVNGVLSVSNTVRVDYDPVVIYRYPHAYYTYDATSDAAIRDDIVDELRWSPFVDANQVNVVVNGGVATLSGTVNTHQEQQAAIENALEGGARNVINNLKIRYDSE